MRIGPYLKEGAFDPELISVMEAAFEDLCEALDAAGVSDVGKDMIAAKIIDLTRTGEPDPVVLRELALNEIRVVGPVEGAPLALGQ